MKKHIPTIKTMAIALVFCAYSCLTSILAGEPEGLSPCDNSTEFSSLLSFWEKIEVVTWQESTLARIRLESQKKDEKQVFRG
ncbi:MAG: hypothetical protein FWE67_12790 [Planctomycetaceae bacterium]|nr:hypothetical protein [Planctomycetaceae bacterium]